MKPRGRIVALVVVAGALAGCSSSAAPFETSGPASPSVATALVTTPSTPVQPTTSTAPSSSKPVPSRTRPVTSTPSAAKRADRPMIVIDPGHSVTIHATDPASGLDVSDYENEPEMRDVFAVAELVRARLVAAGYRVILTKPAVDTPTSLARRAQIANRAHAALALSIHDQAGGNGGIGFTQGNNTVYYQSVGDYRATPSGRRVYFTRTEVAASSKRYGAIFQRKRAAVQGTSVALLGNTGYNLGTRGLPAGNIWIVQLLSKVPWIYNEAGGNSAGRVGLSLGDQRRYATGLVAAVEACVPVGN